MTLGTNPNGLMTILDEYHSGNYPHPKFGFYGFRGYFYVYNDASKSCLVK